LKRGKRDTDPDEIAVDYQDAPEVRGKLWTYPEIVNGWEIVIDIAGDPDGLRSLEEILVYLADYDQSARGVSLATAQPNLRSPSRMLQSLES
jgi:hypothetical protein